MASSNALTIYNPLNTEKIYAKKSSLAISPSNTGDDFLLDETKLPQSSISRDGFRKVSSSKNTFDLIQQGQTVSEPTTLEKPTFHLGSRPITHGYFKTIQQWQGVVEEINTDSITVKLYDKTGESSQALAEIYLNEISESDKPYLRPGAIFYWHVGYSDCVSGQRTKASRIIFRRLPQWSKKEIESSLDEATKTVDLINWK